MRDGRSLGKQGEDEAARFLEKKGYSILERNYRKRGGEIDIVAFDPEGKEYVFVEVKSRQGHRFGTPIEGVDEYKMKKMAETTEYWLMEKGLEQVEWRIDVVGIDYGQDGKPDIEHLTHIG